MGRTAGERSVAVLSLSYSRPCLLCIMLMRSCIVSADPGLGPFQDAYVKSHQQDSPSLASSRAYTLSLSPHVIYTRSNLVPSLVSSKVYKQLEFQAVGSWWIYRASSDEEDTSAPPNEHTFSLHRVPSSREDIFADQSISIKEKRSLMKFLRSLLPPLEENAGQNPPSSSPSPDGEIPNGSFADYLTGNFRMAVELHDPLLSLSLSPKSPHEASASFVLPRIKRHLSSIGVFGPGFGALLTKWGGSAEIAQVACRALAVGGGVYVLGRGVQSVVQDTDAVLRLSLSDDESIQTRFLIGSRWDLPTASSPEIELSEVARAIFIVSSPLSTLFPPTAEGGPVPAGCVVVVPSAPSNGSHAPVQLLIHSSETGECPDGQCKCISSVYSTCVNSLMMTELKTYLHYLSLH
jgi:Rab proteins geranylgeranyltransferase component A